MRGIMARVISAFPKMAILGGLGAVGGPLAPLADSLFSQAGAAAGGAGSPGFRLAGTFQYLLVDLSR